MNPGASQHSAKTSGDRAAAGSGYNSGTSQERPSGASNKRSMRAQKFLSAYEALSLEMAEAVATQIRTKPDCRLGLPTGRTPLGGYAHLVKWSRQGQLDWSRVQCFALDDYVDAAEQYSF